MYEVFTVNVFYSGYELVGEEEDGLEAEAAGAEVEEILQAGAQQLHHHHIVVPCTQDTQVNFRIKIPLVQISVSDSRKFLCRSRIPKMFIRIRIHNFYADPDPREVGKH